MKNQAKLEKDRMAGPKGSWAVPNPGVSNKAGTGSTFPRTITYRPME
jgi:hypothetical protein